MATRECLVCGTEFAYKPSQKRECCSRTCAAKVRVKRRKEAGTYIQPQKPRRGKEYPCATCGRLIYRNKSQAEGRAELYCSGACHIEATRKAVVTKSCQVCGKEMRLSLSQSGRKYCSNQCQGVGTTKRPLARTYNGRRARLDIAGYVMVYEPTHPNKVFHGWQYEHRLVAEKTLGRYLSSDEHVHHINGVKDDNDPKNLAVMDGLEHAALSARDYRDQVEKNREELEEYRRRYGPLS